MDFSEPLTGEHHICPRINCHPTIAIQHIRNSASVSVAMPGESCLVQVNQLQEWLYILGMLIKTATRCTNIKISNTS